MRGFKSLKSLKDYTEKHGRFQDGDIIEVQDEDQLYFYKDNSWHELPGKINVDSNIEISLYDLNKQVMAQLEPFDIDKWKQAEKDIDEWDSNIKASYYMMLCKEKSYYTVFTDDGYEFHGLGAAVRECLEFVGNVVSIDINSNVIEIWIRELDDAYCLHLFDYDQGVVSFKR